MEFTSNAVSKNVIFLINQRLLDIAKQEFDAVLSVSSKCYFYQYIVTNGCLQEYLCKPIPELNNKCITKIRLSSHKLAIEQGRYNKANRNRRTCKLCINEIEDEMHFILSCPSYVNLRKQFIKSYYWKKPSVYNMLQLLSVSTVLPIPKNYVILVNIFLMLQNSEMSGYEISKTYNFIFKLLS